MAKEPLKHLTARLAYKVDRRLLEAEAEDHVRLDLLAHEKAPAHLFKKKTSQPRKKTKLPSLKNVQRFALTAVGIYAALFTITNAPAYSKWIQASLFTPSQISTLAPMEEDLWTGERLLALATTRLQEPMLEEEGFYPLDLQPVSYEDRLVVPSIKVNAPIVEPQLGVEALKSGDWNALEDQIRESLLQGVVHYPGTADPGNTGNAFLTGHSSNLFWETSAYNTVFALLPKIKEGDDIYVTHDQIEYHYKVVSKREVSPTEVSILEQGDQKTLTLMTCTPVGTTLKRLVVTAELQGE